jgi:hypothetical protein
LNGLLPQISRRILRTSPSPIVSSSSFFLIQEFGLEIELLASQLGGVFEGGTYEAPPHLEAGFARGVLGLRQLRITKKNCI